MNADVLKVVFYDEFWSIALSKAPAPPPTAFADDLAQFMLLTVLPALALAQHDVGVRCGNRIDEKLLKKNLPKTGVSSSSS